MTNAKTMEKRRICNFTIISRIGSVRCPISTDVQTISGASDLCGVRPYGGFPSHTTIIGRQAGSIFGKRRPGMRSHRHFYARMDLVPRLALLKKLQIDGERGDDFQLQLQVVHVSAVCLVLRDPLASITLAGPRVLPTSCSARSLLASRPMGGSPWGD